MEAAARTKCLIRLLAALLTAGLLGASVWAAFDQDGDPPVIYVHGTITTQTWTKDYVYIVDGKAGIPVSHTLTIEPGTVVRFDGYYQLIVDGELIADGTAEEPIRFTSNLADPAPGDWHRLLFANTSTDATFDGAGEYIQGSIVRHAIFEYGSSAVYFDDAGPFFAYNTVDKMASFCCGIGGGSNVDENAWPVIVGNVLTDTGIELNWNVGGSSILSNTITGGCLRTKGAGTVGHNSVSDVPPATPHQSLRVGIAAIGHLDVIENQVMRCDRDIGYLGTGLVSGNLVIGNRGHGIGIASSPTVVNNTSWLNGGAAIVVDSGGPPILHYNNLVPRSGQYALRNNTTNDVDATNNWWGTTSEAAIQAAIYDGNDEYGYGIVDYSGYLTGPTEIAIPTAALEVTKDGDPDPVQAGATLTYTIHVTNTGSVDLHATITDTLPLSVTLDKAFGGTLVLPGGTLAPPDGTVILPDGRVAVTWTAVITPPGGLWIGTLLVTVDEGYVGPLTNLVEVTTEEGAAGAYTETSTSIVLYPVYLPLVLRYASGPITVEGEYLLVGNPCITDPCLPGMVYAVLADDTYYYLTAEGAWLWSNHSWDGYTPEIGDFVTVTGYVNEEVDVFGTPFYNIEVTSLQPTLPPPTTTFDVVITDVHAYGTGDQEPDEYVEIRNDGTQSVQLNGWTLHNAENYQGFTFPNHLMQPGQVCRVYTNEDHPDWCGFSYGSESDVWRYANGCAYLRDSEGTLVNAYCYCQSHTAYMTISTTATTLQVGEVVTATVTLFDRGCTGLGMPQYRLYIRSDEPEPIFLPSNPEPVVHYLMVAPGQSDATEFVLQAIEPGQATFSASASFEVHLGYPGPAYWGFSGAGPLAITVMP